jgi:23S rRNA pseudouridine2605 synthase
MGMLTIVFPPLVLSIAMPRKANPGREVGKAPARPKRRKRVPTRQKSGETSDHSGERLQKVLAAAGIASRRDCEQLILEGRVEVDRKVVTELGTRVELHQQEIRVDGEALPRPRLVYFAVNKPTGVVTTARDPAGRPRVVDLLPPDVPRTFAVGRLDISSEGLILMTNDGELANKLTHPRLGIEKIYQVQVAGHVEPQVLAQLQRGVRLAEGIAHAKHVRIKSRGKNNTILEMVLDEGRNREIRRLLARFEHKVQRLKRIAVGPVRLGDLPTGAVRELDKKEVQALHQSVEPLPKGEKPGAPPRSSAKTGIRKSNAAGSTAKQKKPDKSRTVISD